VSKNGTKQDGNGLECKDPELVPHTKLSYIHETPALGQLQLREAARGQIILLLTFWELAEEDPNQNGVTR
jgi:hypothetical protein